MAQISVREVGNATEDEVYEVNDMPTAEQQKIISKLLQKIYSYANGVNKCEVIYEAVQQKCCCECHNKQEVTNLIAFLRTRLNDEKEFQRSMDERDARNQMRELEDELKELKCGLIPYYFQTAAESKRYENGAL